MSNKNSRTAQTVRFLKWIRTYSGWWYLICTPNEEHMNLSMMRTLIQCLYKEGFYEIIFVLLMVHRNDPVMSHVPEYLLLDGLVARWDGDRDAIIARLLKHFD